MIRLVGLVLALVIVHCILGCSAPNERVCLGASLSDDQAGLAESAVAEWNGSPYVNLSVAQAGCDCVVELGSPERADAVSTQIGSSIRVRPGMPADKFRIALLHELGHWIVDSADHSEDPRDVMFERWSWQAGLTERDLSLDW